MKLFTPELQADLRRFRFQRREEPVGLRSLVRRRARFPERERRVELGRPTARRQSNRDDFLEHWLRLED